MELIKYLIISSICFGISFALYKLIFRNETEFLQQRLFLVFSILVSTVLPTIDFKVSIPEYSQYTEPIEKLLPSNDAHSIVIVLNESLTHSLQKISKSLYLGISTILLLIIIFQACKIIWLYSKSEKKLINNFTVLFSSKISYPFSFFNWILIPSEKYDNADIENIIIHERIHATQLHTIDNIIIEIICSVFWFNPFVWIIKKTLHTVHEYLADEGTINSGVEKIHYQTLLVNQAAEAHLIEISSRLNNSVLKKRLIMMSRMKTVKPNQTRTLPIIVLTISICLSVTILNSLSAQNTTTLNEKKHKESDQKELTKGKKVVGDVSNSEKKTIEVIGYGNQRINPEDNEIRISKTDKDKTDSSNYIVHGKYVKSIEEVDADNIMSDKVMNKENMVAINTKDTEKSRGPENIIYLVDKKEVSKDYFENINLHDIKKMSVTKDKNQIKALTGKNGDGLIIVVTKNK